MLYTINGEKRRFFPGDLVIFSIWGNTENGQGVLPFEVEVTQVSKMENERISFIGCIRCHGDKEIPVSGDFNHVRGTGFLETNEEIPVEGMGRKKLAPAQVRGH